MSCSGVWRRVESVSLRYIHTYIIRVSGVGGGGRREKGYANPAPAYFKKEKGAERKYSSLHLSYDLRRGRINKQISTLHSLFSSNPSHSALPQVKHTTQERYASQELSRVPCLVPSYLNLLENIGIMCLICSTFLFFLFLMVWDDSVRGRLPSYLL